MRIANVLLTARRLEETARFYERSLRLPVVREPGEVTVTVGASLLVFQEDPEAASDHHLAFTIPTGSFDTARAWLSTRAELLERDGTVEFEGPPTWNSRSLYFAGPDGSVLELIERRELGNDSGDQFGSDSLLCVSEVGVAVPDVPAAVADLGGKGIRPYGNPPADDFAAVGDANGLLILVPPGRAWFPATDRIAAQSSTKVHLADGRALRF